MNKIFKVQGCDATMMNKDCMPATKKDKNWQPYFTYDKKRSIILKSFRVLRTMLLPSDCGQ